MTTTSDDHCSYKGNEHTNGKNAHYWFGVVHTIFDGGGRQSGCSKAKNIKVPS